MARPEVKGLDYFPFDVGFYRDKKIRLLRGQHGAEGLEIYQRLLCKCYEDNGYYLLWDNKDDFSLIADETGYPEEKVRLIVSTLLSRSLLESILALRGNVLTSRSIQRRYFEAVRATKEKAAAEGRNTVIEEDICLLTEDDFKDLNRNKSWLFIGKTEPNSEINGSKSEINGSKSEINHLKKRRGKKRKEEESSSTPDLTLGSPPVGGITRSYCYGIHKNVVLEDYAYEQLRLLIPEPRELNDYINRLSGWLNQGKKCGDPAATISKWYNMDKVKKEKEETEKNDGEDGAESIIDHNKITTF